MRRLSCRPNRQRRGAIVVLAGVFLVVMVAMLAFALDIGHLGLGRTQLQAAADSAALAAAGTTNLSRGEMETEAKRFASANIVAGRPVQLASRDIRYGTWDTASRSFTPTATPANAVRVTVRTDLANGGQTGLFFGRIFGRTGIDQAASAVATMNPRDIVFVVDLSRSMNFDTNPSEDSSTPALIQNVYDDFGFGSYPGNSQYVGQTLGVANNTSWVSNLTKNTNPKGPLWGSGIPTRYRCVSSDSSAKRTWRAYAWAMEVQMPAAGLMPNLKPVPNAGTVGSTSGANYNYWKYYIDQNRSSLGYLSYVTLMMDKARDMTVEGSYTPLSLKSSLCACPRKDWTVNGESFSFPPREMPTHAARRALIAAIQVVRDRNALISNVDQKDWVSIITFDAATTEAIKWSLSHKDDYAGAMQVCTDFQACGATGTEAGLSLAYNHIKPASKGGLGREHTNKIVVLLTDGQPNDRRTSVSSSSITNYVNEHPSTWTNPDTGQQLSNWITSGSEMVDMNAALMQANVMRSDNWYVYAAGIGRGCDYNFMDCVARQGLTADTDGRSPRGSDDPFRYEEVLRQIFEDIITNPKLRLVQ